jgi:hypothetical protein
MAVAYKKTMTDRKTGAKTTTKGTLTPITKSQFNSNAGRMKKTSKPIAQKTATTSKMKKTYKPLSPVKTGKPTAPSLKRRGSTLSKTTKNW